MTPDTHWYLPNPDAQLRRHWANETEWVVYNAASGDVHLLNEEAVALLDCLAAGPKSVDDLLAFLAPATADAIRDALDTLDRFGLVAPLPS